eukprot:4084535-Pyramimonas_sp.AAC.1
MMWIVVPSTALNQAPAGRRGRGGHLCVCGHASRAQIEGRTIEGEVGAGHSLKSEHARVEGGHGADVASGARVRRVVQAGHRNDGRHTCQRSLRKTN